ncbi:MAG TPA: hypothetical protein DCF49_05310 [Lachnospiraceae bacterium]|nr:hypothetical protein [Lachnospiraceae bacterium]
MALKLLETNITLDLYDHDGTRPSIKSIALDDNTRYVFAKLTYKQELYDIGSDATVKLIIIRPDKVGAQIVGESKEIRIGQEDESIVSIYGAYAELDQPAIAVAGTLLGQFIITSGDQILRSQIFTDNNGQALDTDTWAGDYDGYNLDELVEKVDAAVDKVDGMEADVSELKSGLIDLMLKEPADIARLSTENWPLGWSRGYYSLETGEWLTSQRFICNYVNTNISFDGAYKVILVPPSGYAINALAFKADGTFDQYGESNTTTHPEYADKIVEFKTEGYEYFRVSVGRFTDSSANAKAVDPEFISTIGVYLLKPNEAKLPDYWQTYIKTKALSIAKASTPPIGSGTRFVFITDTHLRGADGLMHNDCHSPALMAYLHDHANIGLAFFGGDSTTSGYDTQDKAVKDLMLFREVFSPVWDWMHSIFGNHDYGAIDSSIAQLNKSTLYNLLIRDKETMYKAVNPVYGSYVIDDVGGKVRFICLNCNEGNNYNQQKNFFCQSMLDAPTGWTIVFITHFSLYKQTDDSLIIHEKLTNTNSVIPAIEAYNARQTYGTFDFTNAGAEVACVIGGHDHFDGMVKTEGGVPVISVTCDRFYGYTERVLGTTAEQAFDVVDIDTSAKSISLTRIGYGSDRTYTYGG